MKRVIIVFVVVMLLMGVVADAQKKKGSASVTPPPVRVDMCVDDEKGEGFILFNPGTQEFSCHMCKYGWVWSGVGKVNAQGMNVYFNAITDRYRIFVSLNVEDFQGKAIIQVLKDPVTGLDVEPVAEYFSDDDIYTNPMSCFQGR